jgi:cytidylate kinase
MEKVMRSDSSVLAGNGAPRHGDPGPLTNAERFVPAALTITISRETGARGGTIGKRISKRLGWAYYDQEMLTYLAQKEGSDDLTRTGLLPPARIWVEEQIQRLQEEGRIGKDPKEKAIAQVIFSIATRGRAIIVGRGAGAMLPAESQLHVRIVAPLHDRIVWIGQLQRLTTDQAADYIQRQDRRRSSVLDTHFRRPSKDPSLYDLVLNSSQLGEQACELIIALAVEQKRSLAAATQGPPFGVSVETLE